MDLTFTTFSGIVGEVKGWQSEILGDLKNVGCEGKEERKIFNPSYLPH